MWFVYETIRLFVEILQHEYRGLIKFKVTLWHHWLCHHGFWKFLKMVSIFSLNLSNWNPNQILSESERCPISWTIYTDWFLTISKCDSFSTGDIIDIFMSAWHITCTTRHPHRCTYVKVFMWHQFFIVELSRQILWHTNKHTGWNHYHIATVDGNWLPVAYLIHVRILPL